MLTTDRLTEVMARAGRLSMIAIGTPVDAEHVARLAAEASAAAQDVTELVAAFEAAERHIARLESEAYAVYELSTQDRMNDEAFDKMAFYHGKIDETRREAQRARAAERDYAATAKKLERENAAMSEQLSTQQAELEAWRGIASDPAGEFAQGVMAGKLLANEQGDENTNPAALQRLASAIVSAPPACLWEYRKGGPVTVCHECDQEQPWVHYEQDGPWHTPGCGWEAAQREAREILKEQNRGTD